MSGHSKWSTIKRKKGAADARRGQMFTRLGKEIALAARGGPDPDMNPRLALAIYKAKAANMPKDNIERAIRRGAGLDKDAAALEEVMYEGYGPHGVAVLVSVVTDNRNRALSEVRRWFTKMGGSLGEAGCVAWQFEPMAYFSVEPTKMNSDQIFDIAVESGADDVSFGDDLVEIYAQADAFADVRDGLEAHGLTVDAAEIIMRPKTTLALGDKEAMQNMSLISQLEDLDDVQDVYSNLDITDDLMERFEAES